MNRRPRLLVYCPTPADGTSLYRGIMPLTELRDIQLVMLPGSVQWSDLALGDIAFVQRPFSEAHLSLLRLMAKNRKPIWIDYDDDLLAVPPDNPTHRVYSLPKVRENLLEAMQLADVVSCSTLFLAERLKKALAAASPKRTPQFRVIPNGMNTRLWRSSDRAEALRRPAEKLIVWRGSDTHTLDLLRYTPEIAALAAKYPEHVWLFIGMNPWMLSRAIPPSRILHRVFMDPMDFMNSIQKVRPAVIHVPLDDSPFNRCKSNIAWIEGSWAGAACVSPDWDEWRRPGMGGNYGTHEGSFFDTVSRVIDAGPEVNRALADESWSHIQNNLSLAQTNLGRMNIITELMTLT